MLIKKKIMIARKIKNLTIGIIIFGALPMLNCGSQIPEEDIPPVNGGDENGNKTEVNVTEFKSLSSSDHEMIQKAIDYAAQEKIPTVYIPAGEYEIETALPGTNTWTGISLRDNIHLKLDDKAVLKAIPNNAGTYRVISIDNIANVKISGGTVKGDRDEHTGTGGEWGMGVCILNSMNIEVRDMLLVDCWGDGLYISGLDRVNTNILVDNV